MPVLLLLLKPCQFLSTFQSICLCQVVKLLQKSSQEYSASSELMMEAVNCFPEAFKSVIDKHNNKYTMVLKDSSF